MNVHSIPEPEYIRHVLGCLREGDPVPPPGLFHISDGTSPWGVEDLMMLAGACLYLLKLQGDDPQGSLLTAGFAPEIVEFHYAAMVAAVDCGLTDPEAILEHMAAAARRADAEAGEGDEDDEDDEE